MSEGNRQWVLKTRPPGLVGPEHFDLKDTAIPEPGEGELLVKTLYFSFDPTQRGWLNDVPSYVPPVAIGEAMRAGGIGQVVKSNLEGFEAGDFVQGTFSWQDYVIAGNDSVFPLTKLDPNLPLTWNISLFGITGLTAYFGLIEVGKVKEGDVVLVSGAAGATGSMVGQIARIKGASKVIGIAGGAEKCAWLVDELGFDGAVDYKSDDIDAKIKEHCPEGVDVFFDNVGGDILNTALANIRGGARIVICGGISTGYSDWSAKGPDNYMMLILHSARMEGFLVLKYMDQFPAAAAQLAEWKQAGLLKNEEHLVEGLENAPDTLQGLFTGKNRGKMILKVAEPA